MKLWSISIHFKDRISLRKFWNFQAISSEGLKLTNSFHRLNQFAKKIMFFEQATSVVTIFIFSKLLHRLNWFPFFFMQATQAWKNWEKSNCFIYWIGSRQFFSIFNSFHRLVKFAKHWFFQASCLSFEVLKLINCFHSLNRFVETWVLQASYLSFEVLNLINSFCKMDWIICETIEISKKATWSMKLLSISLHFLDWIGLRILCVF